MAAAATLERRTRQHIASLHDTVRAFERAAAEASTEERLSLNHIAAAHLFTEETAARHELWDDYMMAFEHERGRRELLRSRLTAKACSKDNTRRLGENKFSRIADRYEARLAEEEERFRQDGLKLLEIQRSDDAQKLMRIDARRKQMKADMEGFKAVRAFIESDQTRQRQAMYNEEDTWWCTTSQWFVDEKAAVEQASILRRQNDELARKREADEAQAAARKHADKQATELRHQQQKLINKCTHSRTGKSVFVGSYAKKMCLICKVKLDSHTGLYVQM